MGQTITVVSLVGDVGRATKGDNMAEAAAVLENDNISLEVARLLEAGWKHADIQKHFGWSRQALRRHISWAMGYLEGKANGEGSSSSSSFRHIPVVGRQVALKDVTGTDFRSGRQTIDPAPTRVGNILPHPDSGVWRLEDIRPEELRRMSPADLIPRMIRISPEMARAYFDFLRMGNPGWIIKALKPGGKGQPSAEGQAYLLECIDTISRYHGSIETTLNLMLTNLYVRGSVLAELVLEQDARTFADIVVPDSYTARFKLVKDTRIGGERWQLVQGTGRDAVVLDRETVKYVALDPMPGSPYGTSVIAPGLFPSLFLLTMLQDARRVVAQQGWPRLDIMIKVEQIISTLPEQDQQDPAVIKAAVDRAVNEVADSYSDLDPDQAWVHTDTVEFNEPIGAIGNLQGVDEMFRLLERMAIRSMKSQPLLFGVEEGMSEASANRQWEVHVQGVKAMQKIAEGVLSSLFTMALQARGILAVAEFKFDELRAAEELRDAQVFFQKLENAMRAELLDYYTHDEAAQYAVGHPAIHELIGKVGDEEDQPEDAEDGSTENPESGAVMEGDTGDEKPPKTDDGTTKAMGDVDTRAAFISTLLALNLSRRDQLKPKGEPKKSGKEDVKIAQGDITAAKRDFDYRIPDMFQGILDAESLDNADTTE